MSFICFIFFKTVVKICPHKGNPIYMGVVSFIKNLLYGLNLSEEKGTNDINDFSIVLLSGKDHASE